MPVTVLAEFRGMNWFFAFVLLEVVVASLNEAEPDEEDVPAVAESDERPIEPAVADIDVKEEPTNKSSTRKRRSKTRSQWDPRTTQSVDPTPDLAPRNHRRIPRKIERVMLSKLKVLCDYLNAKQAYLDEYFSKLYKRFCLNVRKPLVSKVIGSAARTGLGLLTGLAQEGLGHVMRTEFYLSFFQQIYIVTILFCLQVLVLLLILKKEWRIQ